MNKLITLILAVLLAATTWAQSPAKMSYQAVVRDASNNLVINQTVGMQISILQGFTTGTAVYVETQTPKSNANGLVTLEIGEGTTFDDFSAINWAISTHFIKTEIDINGGVNYTITATSQLLSVPYALHAKTAESITGVITETDPVYTTSQASNITSTDITNLGNLSGTNTGDQDISQLAAQIALEDTASNIRADIPDVNGFISNEIDPIFSASQAANVTVIDITNLGNLSGINTGDQDLSSFSTFDDLTDTAAVLRSEIPDVSGFIESEIDPVYASSHAANITTDDITNLDNLSGVNTGDQDLSNLASKSNVLELDNTTPFTPDADYEPATKKYVNDNAASATYSIGDIALGGIVFWVDETGEHGLIAATADQSTGTQWYNGAYSYIGAVRDGIGAGEFNTKLIVAKQGMGASAAQLWPKYEGGNYGDWYLPSKYELNLLYLQKDVVGGFVNAPYWSSTEDSYNRAWSQTFANSRTEELSVKEKICYVRTIRGF